MDALLQIAVLMAFMVAGVTAHKLRLSPPPKVTDAIIKVVLWALLFLMGFRLGNARGLRAELGQIGLLAISTGIATVAGTLMAVWASYAILDAVRGKPAPRTVEGMAHKPTKVGWSHYKGPATLLAVVIVGFIVGVFVPELRVDYSRVSAWVLDALLFMIGLQFAQAGISLKAAFVRIDTVLVPGATIIGTLAGGLVISALFHLAAGKGLALAAGFGWYSLSGVLIADLGDPALGSAAFLANMARESLAFILIPLLATSKRPFSAIAVGGATAMDVTLPLIEQCLGPDSVPISFTSGAALSLIVPILVPLFYGLIG